MLLSKRDDADTIWLNVPCSYALHDGGAFSPKAILYYGPYRDGDSLAAVLDAYVSRAPLCEKDAVTPCLPFVRNEKTKSTQILWMCQRCSEARLVEIGRARTAAMGDPTKSLPTSAQTSAA